MLVHRDRRIVRFIEDFGIASTRQLASLFFPSRLRAQQRLRQLVEFGKLKRCRDYITADYLYYIGKKPREVEHMSGRVDTYIYLQANYQLYSFVPEYAFESFRADAYFEVWRNGIIYPYFLEVQISNYFRQDKYDKVFQSGVWLDRWEDFPPVLVVSDNKIRFKPSNIRYLQYSQKSPITGL